MSNDDLLHELRMKLAAPATPSEEDFANNVDDVYLDLKAKLKALDEIREMFGELDKSLSDGGQYPSTWVTGLNQAKSLKGMPPARCGHPIAVYNTEKCNSYTCWNAMRRVP